jgi:FMN phosphatase YigB (HAD superfamily)
VDRSADRASGGVPPATPAAEQVAELVAPTVPAPSGNGDARRRRERDGWGALHPLLPARTVVSVDVFDTALTRTCGPPEAVWLWLGRRLSRADSIPCSPEVFARARAEADRIVWARAGGLDSRVTLTDFYDDVTRALNLDPALAPSLAEAEACLEAEVLRAVPSARRAVREAGSSARRVVFTSDTYFSGAFLERQLRANDVWPEGSACFASSDHAVAKASGRLYDHLLAEVDVDPSSVVHVGDHPHSDGVMARHRGLRAVAAPEGRLNRYEKLLAGSMWATAGTGAALAGASRLARLDHRGRDGTEQAIVDVAAGVAGPALVAYVLWLLRRAQDSGVRRLVFLARDGQVLHEVAQILLRRLRLPMTSCYLLVSRLSTNLAATFEADDEELGWVFRDRGHLTARQLLERFDLSWDEVAQHLEPLGIAPDAARLTESTVRALAEALQRGPLRPLLLRNAAARRATVTRYLAQEGLLSERCGVVDHGGVGSQIRALHRLIVAAGGAPPRLYLMGMDNPADAGITVPDGVPDWLRDTECYLFDDRRGVGNPRPRGLVTVLQMLCAADHGTVTGYRDEGGRVVPVLAQGTDRAVLQWGLPALRATVRSFAEHVTLDPSLVDPWADLRAPVTEVVREFWARPTTDEARAWGAFPLEGAQAAGSSGQPVATRYSWWSLLRGVLNRSFPNLGWQHWYQGSLQQSPRGMRVALRSSEALYRRLDRSMHPWTSTLLGLLRQVLRGRPVPSSARSRRLRSKPGS